MTSVVPRLVRLIAIIFLAMTVVACGGDATDQSTVTPSPTKTAASAPTEEPEKDDGIVRTAWNKTGDAGGWIWDRVSGAGGWIWGGVSGAGGWMWGRVTGLPGEVSDIFAKFWRWVQGTEVGERAKITLERTQELIEAIDGFSLSGFLWRVVRYIAYALLALIVVGLLLFKLVFPFMGGLPSRIVRTTRRSFQSGRPADTKGRSQRSGAVTATGRPSRGPQVQAPVDDGYPVPIVNVYVDSVPAASKQGLQHQSIDGTVFAARDADSGLYWSKDQIRALKHRVTNPTIVALFDLARASDGEAVNYRELMDVTDRTANQVRADFAAFSRVCRAIRGDEAWPIDSLPSTDGKSRSAYMVKDQYLKWWFEA